MRATALALALALAPASALAQSAPLDLSWTAPSGCLDADSVRAEVQRLTGPVASSGLSARGEVTLGAQGEWRLTLRVRHRGRASVRIVRAESCHALGDAASVILAMIIDPASLLEATGRAEGTLAEQEAPTITIEADPLPAEAPVTPIAPIPVAAIAPVRTAPTPTPRSRMPSRSRAYVRPPRRGASVWEDRGPLPSSAPSVAPPDRATTPWRVPWHVGAAVSGQLFTLPLFSVGPEAWLGVRIGAFRVEAGFTFWPPQRSPVPMRTTGQSEFAAYEVSLRGCYHVRWKVDVGPCLAAYGQFVTAQSSGIAEPGTAQTYTLGTGALLDARMTLWGPLSLRAQLGIAVNLVRPVFVIDGIGPTHQPGWIAPRGALGLEMHF